jgi:uncharacterized protein (DUF1697 family)
MQTYLALMRGINVGGNRKTPMPELKQAFLDMGFFNVSSYINTGNIIFSSEATPSAESIEAKLKSRFGFEIDTLVLNKEDAIRIAGGIPKHWQNDAEQKSYVCYLFEDIDSPNIIKNILSKPEFETAIYTKKAMLYNVNRNNESKSSLFKLIGHRIYKRMTIRNVNTARRLAVLLEKVDSK